MASHSLFGWDMTFKLVQDDIKSASDVIIALAHWYLVKNGNMCCLGVGDDVSNYWFMLCNDM